MRDGQCTVAIERNREDLQTQIQITPSPDFPAHVVLTFTVQVSRYSMEPQICPCEHWGTVQ